MTHQTRRQILTVGAAGLAGAAIAQQAQANTQTPSRQLTYRTAVTQKP